MPYCIAIFAFGFLTGIICRPTLNELKRSLIWPSQPSPRVLEFGQKSEPFDFVLLGDSLIDHGRWTELLPLNIANRGISGDTVAMVSARAHDLPPGPIILMVGVNDLLAKRHTAQILSDYEHLLDVLEGRQVIIQSVIGPGRLPLTRLNESLVDLAEKRGARFLDLRPALGHPLRHSYDGVHLTATGYEIWANELKELHSKVMQK